MQKTILALVIFFQMAGFWNAKIAAQKTNKDGITILKTSSEYDTETVQYPKFLKSVKVIKSSITTARVEPTVIRKGIDSFSLKVSVNSNVASLSLSNNGLFLYQGSQDKYIKFFDDGTHGDNTAGDKIFSINKITLNYDPISTEGKPIFSFFTAFDSAAVVFDDGHKEMQYINLMLAYGLIDPAVIPIPHVTVLSSELRKTDYCLNIVSEASAPDFNIDLHLFQNIRLRLPNYFCCFQRAHGKHGCSTYCRNCFICTYFIIN